MESKLISLMKKSKMVDFPEYHSGEDYKKASNEYLKIVDPKKNSIESIYQVGSIGVPGISDIDYFISYKNNKRDSYGKYHILNLSKDSRYMFYHNCWLVNKYVMENLGYWFPAFNLDLVYGKKINIKKIKDRNIGLILATQYLMSKIPYDLIDYSIKRKKFYQRTMIVSIHSLKHTIKLIDELGYAKKGWLKFSKDFEKFKTNWFNEEDRVEKLIHFASKSIIISLDIIGVFDKILIDVFNITPPKESFRIQANNKSFYFLEKWTKFGVLKKYMADDNRDMRYYPSSFAYYIYLRSLHSGRLGRQMGDKFPGKIKFSIPEKIKNSFLKYENVLNEFNEFNRSKFGMTANGYHTLWAPYYENSILERFHNKVFKARGLTIIVYKKILRIFR